tara:strand:+ start:331 stop:510 length:180 start_codon:yes stop_codon:yes gene_type:complete
MKDLNLLNELEQKIRLMITSLEKEKSKKSNSSTIESGKLSDIEERVKNLINLIDQLEDN